MNAYAILGATIAALVYIPLTIQVWRGTLVQNFATYFLWALLDVVAAGSIMLKGGNFLLPAVYVLCCAGVLVGILRTGTFKWTWLEWMISALVLICMIVWAFVGNREATIVSTVAVAFAGVPQLVDFWKKPREAPLLTYLGFTVANGISILAGNDWSIEERFYPTVCTILTIFFVAIAARRWLPQARQQLA